MEIIYLIGDLITDVLIVWMITVATLGIAACMLVIIESMVNGVRVWRK